METYLNTLKNFANFDGRATRTEYWTFTLINMVIFVLLLTVNEWLGIIFGLAMFVPGLAVGVRRLHDTDRSGLFMLLTLIPILSIALFIMFLFKSTPGENRFGPDPHQAATY